MQIVIYKPTNIKNKIICQYAYKHIPGVAIITLSVLIRLVFYTSLGHEDWTTGVMHVSEEDHSSGQPAITHGVLFMGGFLCPNTHMTYMLWCTGTCHHENDLPVLFCLYCLFDLLYILH